MGRRGGIWLRQDRNTWFATIHGRQVNLGPDREQAECEFHRRKSLPRTPDVARLETQVLADVYLEWAKKRLKPVTWISYQRTLQEWVDAYGRTPAVDLRAYHLTEWIEEHESWNVSSRHLAASIVKIWSRWCLGQGYLEINRMGSARCPKMRSRLPAPAGDLEKLLGAVDNRHFRDFLVVLLDTGCRPGEIRSLTASAINFNDGLAMVSGKQGERVVGLSGRALNILRPLAKRWPEGAVLREPNGNPWASTTLGRYFRHTCRLAGIAQITPYHCRHDFWRRAIEGGADSVTVAKQLGHKSLTTLINHYAHPEPEMLKRAVDSALPTSSHDVPRVRQPRKTQPRRGRPPAEI